MKKMHDPEYAYDAGQRNYRLSVDHQECRNCRFCANSAIKGYTFNFCRYSFDAVVGLAMTCDRWKEMEVAA